MFKVYHVILVLLLINVTSTFANLKIDSIGVENNKGKKVILYKVEQKETYYSISKKYNVNYKDVMEFNDSQFLQPGVILKIPTQVLYSNQNAVVSTNSTVNTQNNNFIEYSVVAKDNLNLIAEKYGTTVNDLKQINNLSSNNLKIGQRLKIPNTEQIIERPTVEQRTTYTPPVQTVQQAIVQNQPEFHIVKAKENLNLIAQKYNTTVAAIKDLNGLASNNLQIGQSLKIPSDNQVSEANNTPPIATTVQNTVPIENKPVATPISSITPASEVNSSSSTSDLVHTVVASETIYSIAKKYNTTTYQIINANKLNNNNLVIGQKLIIKNANVIASNVPENEPAEEESSNILKNPSLKGPASKYGLTQVEEKGVAVWIADQDLDPTKMLVLHRTVAVGTVMKITNPMTNRSTFAKVVGKFTENESTKDVIIVMTKAVADAVGALDKRFMCNISYGALEDEK